MCGSINTLKGNKSYVIYKDLPNASQARQWGPCGIPVWAILTLSTLEPGARSRMKWLTSDTEIQIIYC